MRHQLHNSIFALLFSPHTLIGCLLSRTAQKNRLKLHGFHRAPINHLELEHGTVFNPTRIASIISSWYPSTKIPIPVACTLAGPSITEQIMPMPSAHPTIEQFPLSHGPGRKWDFTYLYSLDNYHYFYVSSMLKATLFQYQLLSITTQLPLRTISTNGMALLSLYEHMAGTTYRPSQLAESLGRCRTIDHLFSHDDLERLVEIPAANPIEDRDVLPLLVACGLLTGETL